jgi:two-component system chemotaxis response regulator CheY
MSNQHRKRILVVDDSPTIRLYLRELLTRWNFNMDEAVTGLVGIEKALTARYDLILADVNMPIMNGYAMVEALRREADVQDVPIVMMSTEAKDSDMKRAYAAGANLYLVKPLLPDQLVTYVHFILGETA